MNRRVATGAALLAFTVVLVWGQSTAAASGADVRAPETRVTAVPIRSVPSGAPAPGGSATPTPTPTTTVAPSSDPPSSDGCDDAIYSSGGGGGATAIMPGAAVIGGVVIRNRLPVATGGGVLSVEVVPDGE